MKRNTNFILIISVSLFIVLFSTIPLHQVFSEESIPALTINNKGNVGLGVLDSQYNLYVAGNAGFSSTGATDFISEFGSQGAGDGQFEHHFGIAISPNDNVYVVDGSNYRVEIFDSTGVFLSEFGSQGSGDGQFNYPVDVAISINGDVYVTDILNQRVQIFDSTGVFLSEFGVSGIGDGEFDNTFGIAISTNDNVYVTDGGNHRVQIFDSTGVFLSEFGVSGIGDGQFNYPVDVAISINGNVYVADVNNNRVQIFDSTGVFLSEFGSKGSGDGQFDQHYGIAIHPNGNVYVTDGGNHRVEIFDSTGVFLSEFGVSGIGDGEFDNPYGIAINPNGRVYVVDNNNNRVEIFGITPALLVDNSNVGIGVISPSTPLSIMGNGGTFPVGITQNQVGGKATMELTTNDRSGNQATRILIRGDTDNGDIEFYTGAKGKEIVLTSWSGAKRFVGIGTASPSQTLDVNGHANAHSWLTVSSEKWKKDITPLYNTLDKITQLQGVTYQWRADQFQEMAFDDKTQVGFIAEELEIVYPELVHIAENGNKSIDYGKLAPILVEAIKEQQDTIEQLKSVICPNYPELSACQ